MAPLRFLTLIVAFWVSFAQTDAFAAGPVTVGKSGDWIITLSTSAEEKFETCLASKSFDNGESVMFYTDGARYVLLGLLLKRWQLDERTAYDVSLKFGDGKAIPAKAEAGPDQASVLFDVELSPYLRDIDAADKLTLLTGAGPIDFDISGAGEAIDSAIRCAISNNPEAQE